MVSGAGIQALLGQLFAEPDDQLDSGGTDRGGRGVRAARARLERRLALGPVPGHQPGKPALGHLVGASYLGLATALDNNRGDHKTGLRHPRDCRATDVSYVPTHRFPMS